VPDLTTAATFFDLVISGTTTDVGAGGQVSVGFAGVTYPESATDSTGAWSVTIPQTVLAGLRDQGTTTFPLSATVTDAAGNTATALAPITPSYSTPSLTITNPGDDVVRNSANVGDPLVISGQTVPGASVVVTIGGTPQDAVLADSAGNWATTATSLPVDGSYTISASATLNSIAVASPATVGLVIDTIAPVVTITDAGTGADLAYNEAEREAGFTISGTVSDSGLTDTSTIQVQVDFLIRGTTTNPVQTVTATVAADGTWQAVIPPDSSFLQHNTEYDLRARAVDGAGNTGQTVFDNIRADFVATATINPFTITTVNTFTGLTVTGTTTGVEQTLPVTLSLGGQTYPGQVGMDGTWSVQIPATDIAALGDDAAVTATVSVSDSAGNPASATASTETDFSQPPLTITSPVADSFINAADSSANDNFLVSGEAIPGQTVTLVTPNVAGGRSAIADSTTGEWSFSIPRGDLASTDGPREITVSLTTNGQTAQASITVNVDLTAPILTLESEVTEAGLVVSGTASEDLEEVTLRIVETDYQISVTNGEWSITIAAELLPAPSPFTGSANVTVSGADRAGNEASPQSITLQPPSVDFGSNSFVMVGADAFVNGFSVSGGTSNMDEGSIVTVASTDNPATFSTTAIVQADGSWTATFPASQVQAAADGANLQLTATVTGTSYPVTRSAGGFTADVNIPVSLSVDPIGTDGALILSETGDITLSGRTSGVQQGETVTISTGGAQVGTATVAADGTWTTTIARPDIDPGEAVNYSFSVSNASGTNATATGDLVGYLPSVFSALYLAGTSPLEFFVNTELENVASGGISFFTFDLSYDTSVVSLRPATTEDVEGQQVATGGLNSGFALGERRPNTDSGDVTVVAARLTGQITNFDAEPVYSFEMDHIDPSSMIIITLSDVEVNRDAQQNPIQAGSSVSYTGTNGADTITAANVDTFIRGRGGDDSINVSAPGVNTIIFEPDPAANGVDEITGFTVGGALADRIAFAFSNDFQQSALRGAGTMFELWTGDATGPLGADVGLVVFTTSYSDEQVGDVLLALGLQEGDVIYALAESIGGAGLVQITAGAGGSVNPQTDFRNIAVFNDLTVADLAQFSSANILGFEQYSV
jgi:large repetitive protein